MHLAGAALGLALLASCQIIVEPNPWPPAGAVNVNTGSDTLLQGSRTLANGESVVYRLSNTLGTSGVVYIELNTGNLNVELEVLSSSGALLYSSGSRHVFGSGLSGLSQTSVADLEPQGIVTNVSCRGSCVIIPGPQFGSTLYARVTNKSGSPQSIGVYFFKDVLRDSGEPENDTGPGAPFLSLTDDFGAIETVGDVDYFNVVNGGNLTFSYIASSGSNLALTADIYDASQAFIGSIAPGQSFVLLAGDRIRVRATNASQAGVSQSSGYRLSYPASLEGANVVERLGSQ